MIAVLQRVSRASVTVENKTVGACGKGLCILLGVARGDTEADAEALGTPLSEMSEENRELLWQKNKKINKNC